MEKVLLQYGALGVFVLVLIYAVKVMSDRAQKSYDDVFGRLQKSYDDEKARADRLEEQLRQLNETMRTDYMTTLNVASQAITDANRAVADALAAVRRGS